MSTLSHTTGSLICATALLLAISACSKDTAEPNPKPASRSSATGLAPSDSQNTTALGRAVESARSIAATQVTAGQLLQRYEPQLKTLQTGLSQIQEKVSANPSLLTGDAKTAYQQLTALVPELRDSLASLRHYEADAPVDISGKLPSDFAKAGELFAKLTSIGAF